MIIVRFLSDCKNSIRQWKNKIKEWNISKNLNQMDMQILVAKRDARTSRGLGTVFLLDRKEIENDRLDRSAKRFDVSLHNEPSPSARMYAASMSLECRLMS